MAGRDRLVRRGARARSRRGLANAPDGNVAACRSRAPALNRGGMHNRALHDSLAAFVEEAAWQLAEEVSGGAEIPFELDATPTRSSPLYCYRPLTGRFIAQRIGMLSRLPCYPSAAQGLTALPDLPAYLQRRGRRVPAGDPRALADSALQAFLGAVWADATDFVFERERFNVAYAELEDSAYGGCELSVVITAVEGLVDRVRRGPARRRAPPGARDDPRRRACRAVRRPARDRRRAGARVEHRRRARARERRPPPAPAADRAAPVGRRRARARPDGLGEDRRQRLDGRPARHRPAPPGRRLPAGRRGGGPAARVLRPRLTPHAALRASWPGRCGASSSAASAAARWRRSPTG